MRLTVLTDNRSIAEALRGVDTSTTTNDPHNIKTLNADLGTTGAIAFSIKSLTALPKLARSLYSAVAAVVTPKPKGKLVLKGPRGEVQLELANISEARMMSALQKIFEMYDQMPATAPHERKTTRRAKKE